MPGAMARIFASSRRHGAFLRWLIAAAFLHSGAAAAYAAEERPNAEEPAEPAGPVTIGYVETVELHPGNIRITAKIDSGARSSSLDAANIQPFSKDGKEWVRFTLHGDNDTRRQVELPVERTVGIRRAGAPVQRRYVVKIGVCLATSYKMAEVSLVNREGLNYRMLIGRAFMMEKFVIDPNATFLTRPSCQKR